MKVFVVRSGTYSDKAWHGIFSTPEKAEACVKELNQRKGCDEWLNHPCDPETFVPSWNEATCEVWDMDALRLADGIYVVTISDRGQVLGWEFEDWRKEALPARQSNEGYIGYGATLELARRSAAEYRRMDIIIRSGGA
jgi:hypothetical protein